MKITIVVQVTLPGNTRTKESWGKFTADQCAAAVLSGSRQAISEVADVPISAIDVVQAAVPEVAP